MRLLVRLWTALRAAGTFWKIQSPLTLIHLQSKLDSLQFLKTLKDTSLWFSFLWVDEDAGRQIFQLALLIRGDCVSSVFNLVSLHVWLGWHGCWVSAADPLSSQWWAFKGQCETEAAAQCERSNRDFCLETLGLEMFHHITYKEEENSIPDFIQMFYLFKA